MNSLTDRAGPVREGEELPLDPLKAFLKQKLPDLTGVVSVEQFSHGHSNLTYLVRVGDTELVLRRPPFGNQVKTAHDMGREFRVLSGLTPIYALAPRPVAFCDDLNVLGAPFYIMARQRGVILRSHLPPGLIIDPPTARSLCQALIDNLAVLHSLDYQAAGLGDLGKPDGYVARQVTGWSKRYSDARTDDLPAMERVAKWLHENMPGDSRPALIHNDYKYDNLVLNPENLTQIVAVLDWEMTTIGDPLMDLGTMLGYWVEASDADALRRAAMGPTFLPGSLTRRELVDRYQQMTGRAVTNALFYYCFGLFKIAVIIQQIYARFVRGHTRDPRFGRLNSLVAVLSDQADRSLETGKL
jgi:aminoglycoside phosphotransferase (APT) family kinase protein